MLIRLMQPFARGKVKVASRLLEMKGYRGKWIVQVPERCCQCCVSLLCSLGALATYFHHSIVCRKKEQKTVMHSDRYFYRGKISKCSCKHTRGQLVEFTVNSNCIKRNEMKQCNQ